MAKDLYESRQMVQSPLVLFLIMPIIGVLILLAVDFTVKTWTKVKLENDTKEILTMMLDNDILKTEEDYKKYAVKRFSERGYETADVSIILADDGIILINYKTYFSMLGTVIGRGKKLADARYIGNTLEDGTLKIEKYIEEETE